MAILRLMMPTIKITAQQPGINPKTGLADETGNLNAIACGANLLFCDLLPDTQADAFRPIDQRHVSGLQHCEAVAQLSGLTLDLGGNDMGIQDTPAPAGSTLACLENAT